MSLNADDVQKIAHLSRLQLADEDVAPMTDELTNILGLVEQMSEVSTEGVVPMSHPLHMTQRLRTDEVTEENRRDRFQSISPAVEDGLFLVPRVIE